MPNLLQLLATLGAALFAGTALLLKVAEHRARMSLALAQAPFALIGFFYGMGVWVLGGGLVWLVAALVIGMVVPFTFVNFMPGKWPRLNTLRSVSSLFAAGLMLYGLATSP
jgi:hypothetical protein